MQKSYTIVSTALELEALEAHLNSHDYFAFDTETTGLNVRKDKVIGLSISGEPGTAFYLPLLTWNKHLHCLQPVAKTEDFLRVLKILSQKELLTWNGSFDLRIVKSNFGIDFTEALFADIMLMKHTVDEEGDFALKKVAVNVQQHIGFNAEEVANQEQIELKENIKANGGSVTKDNYEMYKADLEILGKYACSDADLTLRLAHYFKDKLEQEGLEEFFYDKEVMPLYKYVTIPMEEHGICLDLPLIESTRADLIQDMHKLEERILGQLNAYPEVQTWLRKRADEDYAPKNTGTFAQAFCDYYQLPLPKTAAGKYSLTQKAISTLPESGAKNFLLTGAAPISDIADTDLGQALGVLPFRDISWALFQKAGLDKINISSKQQMGQIVFDCLGIKPLSKTEKGSPQFDDDLIQHLVDVEQLSWARDLSNYNKLVKIKGTYIDRFLEEQEDGKFYPSFQQHRTVSGRYSSDLQQLPRPKEESELDPVVLKYNNVIRQFFISAPGRVFIDDDYESLEPHVFAHVSGDEGLKDIFRKNFDFYSTIAIATEKLQGVSADKKADNYLGKLNKPKRQSSKVYSLGIPYGQTPYALGKTLGISTKEAEVLYDGYLNGFPDLKKWMEYSKRQAQLHGFVKVETGRVRHLPKVKDLYQKHGDQLLNFMYQKKLEAKFGKDLVRSWVMDYKNGINNARNVQIQGLGASIVNIAMIAINRELKQRGIDGWVCCTVHDQVIVDVPEDRAKECAQLVQHIMENSYPLSIKLKAPAAVGRNFREAH